MRRPMGTPIPIPSSGWGNGAMQHLILALAVLALTFAMAVSGGGLS